MTALGRALRVGAAVLTTFSAVVAGGGGGFASTGPLVLRPDPADFGSVAVNTTRQIAIVASNRASAATVTVTGARPLSAPFAVVEDGCRDKMLSAGAGCTVTISFRPTTSGSPSASIFIDTSAGTATGTVTGDTDAPKAPPARPTSTTTSTSIMELRPTTTTEGTTTSTALTGGSISTLPGTSTTTPSSPPTNVSDQQRLAECERVADNATVSYPPSLTLTVGETERVRASASAAADEGPGDDGVPTTVEPVDLECEFEAQLRGSDFHIDPETPQPGSFIKERRIEWSWDVSAKRPGQDLVLTLEVTSKAVVADRVLIASSKLFEATVRADVKPESAPETFERISGEVVDHPLVRGFGSLAVVAAALAAAWRWLLKRPWPWAR